MADSKVETIARLAQWKVENFSLTTPYKRSDPFRMGIWTWHLSVERTRLIYARIFPEPSRIAKDQPPIARFVMRVTTSGSNRRTFVSSIQEKELRSSDDFGFPVDSCIHGPIIIDVEFLELMTCPSNGGDMTSIWPVDGTFHGLATQSTLRCLSRMLDESIHADVTINTVDGTMKAHKAILSASSPVFCNMFQHNLKEKESSTIYIEDMTSDSCVALLSYLYGTIYKDIFWRHRLALLAAANKYDIVDLKDLCEESLLEDISTGNVLERLQEASLYQLDKLKKGCLIYLLDFGKIYDVREELNTFFRQADMELVVELFQELLAVWKPV